MYAERVNIIKSFLWGRSKRLAGPGGPRGFQEPPLTGSACVHACARGLGAGLRGAEVSAPSHPRALQTRPRSLSGASPHPFRFSGPRGPGGIRLRGPPPPNPRGPGASEPPAGLGAAKLERPNHQNGGEKLTKWN